MTDAQLDSYAFTVDGAQLLIDEDIDLTLSGAWPSSPSLRMKSDARYTALKMQDVTVTADLSSDSFGLTGAVTISRLDYNLAEEDFDRLDWTQFDFDGDGTNEALNPGAELPTPVDLTIDYPREFVRRVTGSVTGNGDQPNGDRNRLYHFGDVSLAGTAEFAVTRYERDIEAMTDAQLDSYAFTVDGAQLLIDEDIDLTLSGAGRRHHRSG